MHTLFHAGRRALLWSALGFFGLALTLAEPTLSQGSVSSLTLPFQGTVATSVPAFSVTNTGTGSAIEGRAASGRAIYGQNGSTGNFGYLGGPGAGLYGLSPSGTAIYGKNTSTGTYGYMGAATRGVFGSAATNDSIAVLGIHPATGNRGSLGTSEYGVHARLGPSGHAAIRAEASGSPAARALSAESGQGTAVEARAYDGVAIDAYSGLIHAIDARALNDVAIRAAGHEGGIHALSHSEFGAGVNAIGSTFRGTAVLATDRTADDGSRGYGVRSNSPYGHAIHGTTQTGFAGYFEGPVEVVGTLTATTKNFRIDHPLDPANKTLSHACVESSEPANVYSGNVVLDGSGAATVELPEWFEALNGDFRYQLTAIGSAAPSLHVAREISGGRFQIAGGRAGMKVSWEVTAVRRDAYTRAHPLQVEAVKPERERGKYIHPREHGQPESMGVGYEERQRLAAQTARMMAEMPRLERPKRARTAARRAGRR
jgi:hypothetical protein